MPLIRARSTLGKWLTLGAFVALVGCGASLEANHPEAGSVAPEFQATTHTGEVVRLGELRGQAVVLFFYPKDDTPGCTKEACAFRDSYARFTKNGARVFGVSRDDAESHREFVAKHKLPFPLLLDEDGKIADAYGVSSVLGMNRRVTFVIDGAGRVAKVFPDVDPGTHAEAVLRAITALPRGEKR